MNNDILAGNWLQLKGNIVEQWGKLTNDDLDVIAGRRDQMAGKLQERYGIAKDEAERQISEFEKRYKMDWQTK
ncbi:MAG: CsbD family protein [Bryobacteraceae bacterium]